MSTEERAPATAELIEIGRDIIATVGAHDPASIVEVKTARMANMGHFPYVHGFVQHTLQLGGVALDLWERGHRIEVIPTLRTMYECALTACWLSDSREAPAAIYNKDAHARKLLAETMRKSPTELFRAGAASVADQDLEKMETIADAQAKSFQQRCMALTPGGVDAYLLYRAFSAYSHPSSDIADYYVEEHDNDVGMRLRMVPSHSEGDDMFLFLGVAAMVWASRARDVMKVNHPHRNYLREMARRLQIPDVLRLSQEAYAAEVAAVRARRRATRKGPHKRGD